MIQNATVDFSELMKAVALPKMKRGPLGAKGDIPKTTILYFAGSGLLVEAPAHTTMVPTTGNLHGKILVNAALLEKLLKKLPKTNTVELGIDKLNQQLIMKVASLTVTLKGQLIT